MGLAGTEDFVVEVESATPATWLPINDMTAFSKTKSSEIQRVKVLMRAVPHALGKAPEYGLTMSGLLNTTDAGQMRIRAQEALGLPVNIRVQAIDGAGTPAGYTQVCLVSNLSHDANADDPFQAFGFELVPTADPVIVGAGPIIG